MIIINPKITIMTSLLQVVPQDTNNTNAPTAEVNDDFQLNISDMGSGVSFINVTYDGRLYSQELHNNDLPLIFRIRPQLLIQTLEANSTNSSFFHFRKRNITQNQHVLVLTFVLNFWLYYETVRLEISHSGTQHCNSEVCLHKRKIMDKTIKDLQDTVKSHTDIINRCHNY